ncbi:ATP-dependent RNA helicase DHX30 [Corythoichthys intestinalis]|uniref:ATP-dependent RNA helicase DHX30 n=1 Tax=Corythoichthys intestinalis TaxID=161448 RepID=UPI0025A52C18|nr:ATP-dependent RNA helicase DHX30 [Corythoichthys intestinalis]XP_061795745.1 ATP-dependent RNA helicase DHX30-like [Nerophis lumbriciformis]
MAPPGTLLVRFRALCNLGKCLQKGVQIPSDWDKGMRWCGAKMVTLRSYGTSRFQPKRGNVSSNLLEEFPDPKNLLNSTIARSLGVNNLSELIQYNCTEEAGVKKATVTVLWPSKIEEDGYASKKIDAERYAAAAACHKLKEMGVIGPDNQLPRRRSSRGREFLRSSFYDDYDEDFPSESIHIKSEQPPEIASEISEALSLFPHPKALLTRVVQVATSSQSSKELIRFTMRGGKLKTCELTLRWPQEMTFTATASKRVTAEKQAAALACMKLKELQLLDKNNNPLTHAKYHGAKVKEAVERERRPLQVEVPPYLEERMRKYLAQYPVEAEVQKLYEEEEDVVKQEEVEGEDSPVDAITGKPYRPWSPQEEQRLNEYLQEKWQTARPILGTELPVDSHRERVVSAVRTSRAVVIAGETGCGKTTRIPRFLLEDGVLAGHGSECNILVTQPRRISAVSVAHRVAQEMGPALKHSVGYQVRLESRPPEQSAGALLFLTVGVLLRKLQSNPTLKGISHVVVDEVHERDVNTDLLLALLRTCMNKNPDLRVVLMSATGDNQRLAHYFGGCPIVKVPGFMHPVRDRYLEDVLREMRRPLPSASTNEWQNDDVSPDLDLVADVIEHIDRQGEPGALLCFLPGWQDIKTVQETLQMKPHFSSGSHMILPLHSSLSVADQQVVFQRPPEGQRKIVLATNIAETSITIDDVVHVVDAGMHKEHSYDPRTKVSCLDTVWIARSNVTQRKGRAGRCQPGQSYHLFPRKQLDAMSPFPIPEILRTPLESLVVQAKIHSPKLKAVDFLSQVLDSPEQGAVSDAVRNLQDIGVLDQSETLTLLGERVTSMSCDPRLGKVLVLGALFRCSLPMLTVAACLTRDPFYNSLQNRALVNKAKASLSGSSCSDYLVFSRAVLGWRRLQHEGDRQDRDQYLEDHSLSKASLRFINGLISQFSENLREAQLVSRANDCQHRSSLVNQYSEQEQLLKAVLLAGLYPNLIQVKRGIVTKGGRFRPNSLSFRTLGSHVLLHRSSVNRGNEELPFRWLTFFGAVKSNGNVFIRDSSAVHPLALLLLTDCDVNETISGNEVEVALAGHSLTRCQLSATTWELLWDLRMSVQAMLRRNLRRPAGARHFQDGKLISLLVELLNHTDANPWPRNESEVD